MTDPVKTIEEISEQVEKGRLNPDDEGDFQPFDAMRDLRVTQGQRCGEGNLGWFLGIRNTNRSRRIHAHYQISSNINGPWPDDQPIGPGQTAWIACSYPAPTQYLRIEITGAMVE